MRLGRTCMVAMVAATLLTSCTTTPPGVPAAGAEKRGLARVAESDRQWTGVTVSSGGRLFVCYPRWSDEVPVSVERFVAGASAKREPFPNAEWNEWESGMDPTTHFVCVQSVVADAQDRIWVLDAANPRFEGVVRGGPKLIAFDAATGEHRRTILFPSHAIRQGSYLNDVRIDLQHHAAYVTDSHAAALLVVDLRSGHVRRLLERHPAVHSERTPIVVDGTTWKTPAGELPNVHIDGIALDRERDTLYFHALTGTRLYLVRTRWLRDLGFPPYKLAARVRPVAKTGPADGLLFGRGREVLVTDLENHAIRAVRENGTSRVVVQDPRLKWPDTLAEGPDGTVYVTTSQIHLAPDPASPYALYRIPPPGK